MKHFRQLVKNRKLMQRLLLVVSSIFIILTIISLGMAIYFHLNYGNVLLD